MTHPFQSKCVLSENLLLAYATALPAETVGWGRLQPGDLERVLALHTAYADLMRRTPYLAGVRSSTLLAQVLGSMRQAVESTAKTPAIGKPSDRVLFIAGHDTNISNISGMLDLTWKLPGYPRDDASLGGALVFSVWRDPARAPLVTLRVLAQTPEQLQSAATLSLASPPAFADLPVPGCATAAPCPWPAFAAAVERALGPTF